MGDIVFGDKYGGDRVGRDKIVQARRREPRRQVILLMSANPRTTQPLRLDEERREIDRVVTTARAGARLEIRTADALRLDDLQGALLRHRPAIAHFSGHGLRPAGIMAVDDYGQARPVPPRALSALFGILRDGLDCVVLNACFTDDQARMIAEHVPYVVGMRNRIADDAAILFATGFYQGVAHDRSIPESFELGRNRLSLHGHADEDLPLLVTG